MENIVLEKLKSIREQLIDLSEGNLGDFEDDPEASVKSYIDGLLDTIDCTVYDIKNIYLDYQIKNA
jgi:hypothetical protein